MTYGSFNVAGIQFPTEGSGSVPLGPFGIAFSNTAQTTTVTVNTTSTVSVPSTAGGVAIIPNTGNVGTIKFKTVSGDSGTYISPNAPSFIEFDTINSEVPANIYLVTSVSTQITLQFL